jgi:putative ABC transport system ATP-binding protein
VFQEFYLIHTLSALENVMLPSLWSGRDLRQKARSLLERVGLGHRISHRPSELSGGEMQRVAVARALVNSPRLLLADEPTGNLDTKTRDSIFDLLQELNRDEKLTVIVATHDLSLEPRFQRMIHLEEGNVC